jgi:hypothetical protein
VSSATVTPSGVREGDPASLSALCAVRGPSVLAYCRHVAGEAEAGGAAADAFARFRVAVVAAEDMRSLDPEALLISATRTSAAARVTSSAQGDCAEVPAMLAGRADRTISGAELERLESHLEQCWACRAPVARFMAAERAYRDPPEKTIAPDLTEQIVGALIAAVPAAPPAGVGTPEHSEDTPSADPQATQVFAVEQPTEHFSAPGMIESESPTGDAADPAPAEARPRASRRTRRKQPPPARSRRTRPRSARRAGLLLPVILVLLALLGALFVSGALGGDHPASNSGVTVPSADPDDAAAPELVVVPGAKDASGDAVETAKARERARERGDSVQSKQAAKADAAPAAATPPPAVAPTPPAPPAAPAVDVGEPARKRPPSTGSGAQKQIDAGGGAVGSEQIPPASDTADVPELAPPP